MSTPSGSERVYATTVVIVLVCTVLVLSSGTPEPIGSSLPVVGIDGTGAFRAYVVVQPADCTSNLEFARVFAPEKFRRRLPVTGLVTGRAVAQDDLLTAQRKFEEFAGTDHVIPLSRKSAGALAGLGFTRTPFLVIVDSESRVRFASEPPRTFEGLRAFDQLLTIMTRSPAE